MLCGESDSEDHCDGCGLVVGGGSGVHGGGVSVTGGNRRQEKNDHNHH